MTRERRQSRKARRERSARTRRAMARRETRRRGPEGICQNGRNRSCAGASCTLNQWASRRGSDAQCAQHRRVESNRGNLRCAHARCRDSTPVSHICVRFISGRPGPCPDPDAGHCGMPGAMRRRFRSFGPSRGSDFTGRCGLKCAPESYFSSLAQHLCTAAGFLAHNVTL